MKDLEHYTKKGYFYEAVVEDGSDIIFIVDYSGKIYYHNASVRETLGYRSNSLISKNFFDYILPETLKALRASFAKSQKRAYTEKVEFQFLCKDGSYRFLEFNAINLKFKDNINGFILDCRDITQRKRDAEELLRLQKAKEQFLANISHEIRTPINGIAGMASLLRQKPSPEELEIYLNAIRHSAENLKVIINDILDLASIESGKLRFEKIAFNIKDLLPSLLSTFAYHAQEKKINLQHIIDGKLNKILIGDPVRLNQILINLVSNAVKFTQHGSINVNCDILNEKAGQCWVRIEVSDTGAGIPPEKLMTIFESFSQADESVTRKYGGTGLGLTIVKQLVELQNGIIEVKSEEHVGSTFTVIIPYLIGKPKEIAKMEAKTKKDIKNIKVGNLSVLLVEDNDINRLYAKSILKLWKCHTETAENGLVAIEKVKSTLFDVILMDIQMPVMDGYEATHAIRHMEPPYCDIPIVALTANATKADVEKCLSIGMSDYLPKPFTPEDLYNKLFDDLKIRPTKRESKKEEEVIKKISYDLNYLREVSGNNKEFIQEMVQTFVTTIPKVLDEMQESMKAKDWDKVSGLAHQIKPSLTLMGLSELKNNVVLIEQQCKAKTKLSEIPDMVFGFSYHCENAIAELKKELV